LTENHTGDRNNAIIDYEDDIVNALFRTYSSADNSSETREREQQANYFAAELLMPEDVVKEARGKLKDIAKLSDIFNVSEIAITYRLINL
jgi:Zn-dependent peptidase ImmA (M78 family)